MCLVTDFVSKGIAFTEYLDPMASNGPALETLNGMDVGGKKLKITKACIGPTQVANFDIGITAISGLASQTSNDAQASRVIQLLNMVTPEELLDNDDYEGRTVYTPLRGPLSSY
jgi:splicing factor U2AF subunit